MSKNNDLNPLLHAIGTAQVMFDELDNLSSKKHDLTYYKHDLKKAIGNFKNTALQVKGVLGQIWKHIPQDEFDDYIEAKRNVIRKLQNCTFEEIKELDDQITDVHNKYKMLDVFERMIGTHCSRAMADIYREQLGYTLNQYLTLQEMKEKGIANTHNN